MKNSISNLTKSNYELYNIKSWYYDINKYKNEKRFIISSIDISSFWYNNIDDFIINWFYEKLSYSIFLIYFW